MAATHSYRFAMVALMSSILSVTCVSAQVPPPVVVPPTPNLNPSSSLVLPPTHQLPVSPGPGVSGFHYYHSGCSVFRHGPCFPHYLPPIGQDLRLTIVSTDDDSTEKETDVEANKPALDSIRSMFALLRTCWLPPAKDEAHHGMEYTIRFAFKNDGTMVAPPRMTYSSHDVTGPTRDVYRTAIDAAMKRCIPLRFSTGMAGAVAGRPINIRFVDNRTIDPR
jgi:hypothetical protein